MARLLNLLIILSFGSELFGAEIKGTVTDKKGEALPGVNVYIKDTYDGATTDLEVQFL